MKQIHLSFLNNPCGLHHPPLITCLDDYEFIFLVILKLSLSYSFDEILIFFSSPNFKVRHLKTNIFSQLCYFFLYLCWFPIYFFIYI
jgi:hypothetical protein